MASSSPMPASSTAHSVEDKSVEAQYAGMIHIRKRSLIIGLAVSATIIVIALALGLGLGLGLPARDRAAAAAAAAAASTSSIAAAEYFLTHSWGPAATSYRAADSAYVTTTVPLIEYSLSDRKLLSGTPTSHGALTVTQLAVDATQTALRDQGEQRVPQFFSAATQPVFVTTATYQAPTHTGRNNDDDVVRKPEPTHYLNSDGQYVEGPPAEKLGTVDCPQPNGTQYIDPGTGAVFTKLCYKSLFSFYNQVTVSIIGTVSLDECISKCADQTFENRDTTPYLGCNAVSYDANVTRSGVEIDDPSSGNCKLWALLEDVFYDLTFRLQTLNTVPGDRATSVAVRQGFIPGYTDLVQDFRLDG